MRLATDLAECNRLNWRDCSKLEVEADKFSVGVVGILFLEQNNRLLYSYQEAVW